MKARYVRIYVKEWMGDRHASAAAMRCDVLVPNDEGGARARVWARVAVRV